MILPPRKRRYRFLSLDVLMVRRRRHVLLRHFSSSAARRVCRFGVYAHVGAPKRLRSRRRHDILHLRWTPGDASPRARQAAMSMRASRIFYLIIRGRVAAPRLFAFDGYRRAF